MSEDAERTADAERVRSGLRMRSGCGKYEPGVSHIKIQNKPLKYAFVKSLGTLNFQISIGKISEKLFDTNPKEPHSRSSACRMTHDIHFSKSSPVGTGSRRNRFEKKLS